MESGNDRSAIFEMKGPLIGGLVAAVGLFGTVVAVGRIGDFEALRLIEAVLPTSRFLASTAIGAGVTILTLLLTLLALTLTLEMTFHTRVYRQAKIIAILSLAAIVLGTGILLAVTMPIAEVSEIATLYDTLYYGLVVAISLLGGVMVAIGLMITSTVIGVIELAHPEGSNDMLLEVAGEETRPTDAA